MNILVMVKHQGGSRRKSRSIFRKAVRERGKISLVKYFQAFKEGERVQLTADPAIQDGFYHHRFHGRAGIVKARRGRCYEVMIKDKNKEKMIIIHPVHLRKLSSLLGKVLREK